MSILPLLVRRVDRAWLIGHERSENSAPNLKVKGDFFMKFMKAKSLFCFFWITGKSHFLIPNPIKLNK